MEEQTLKICKTCGRVLRKEKDFRICGKYQAKECKKCQALKNVSYQRKSDYKRKYGITVEEYNSLLESQDYSCKICGKNEDEFKYHLCVDHNHETGEVRGLLCKSCNTFLGKIEYNLNKAVKSIEYLREYE